jgi:hypothetical protein
MSDKSSKPPAPKQLLKEGVSSANLQKGLNSKPTIAADSMSSAILKKGLSSANLQTALSKPPAPAAPADNKTGNPKGSK